MNEKRIHYQDVSATAADVLLELPHNELEDYIREARSILDNAQMVHDRLRAVRIEKIRQECMQRKTARGGE